MDGLGREVVSARVASRLPGPTGWPTAPATGRAEPIRRGRRLHELAGWWPRVGAALIDLLIGVGLPVLLGVAFGLTVAAAVGVIIGLIGVLCGFAYPSLMIWKTDGRTVGKRATGIRVLQKDGRPFDAGAAFLREFVVKGIAVSTANSATAGAAGLLNALWPLWDDENRAVHDMLVSTHVVKDEL